MVARSQDWEGTERKETQETLWDDGVICVLIVMAFDTIVHIC